MASSTAPSHSVINVDAGTTARGEKGIFTSESHLFFFYFSFLSLLLVYLKTQKTFCLFYVIGMQIFSYIPAHQGPILP